MMLEEKIKGNGNISSQEELADYYLDLKKEEARIIANATFMCIISPAVLILLAGMSEDGIFHITESFAVGSGLIILLGLVAAAVYLFITCVAREKQMERIEREFFERKQDDLMEGLLERSCSYEVTFVKGTGAGVTLCILSVIPMLFAGIMDASDSVYCASISILLLLVATGVRMIIQVGIVKGGYNVLLQEAEIRNKTKKEKEKMHALSSIYWCLVTAIYLGWSFWGMQWNITWIIWPVAGVVFAAVSEIVKIAIGHER